MNDLENSRTRLRRPAAVREEPAAGPTPADLAWEGKLVLLLSTLEASRTHLHDCCARGEAVPALGAMLTMGERLADFAGRNPDPAGADAAAGLREQGEAFAAAARKLRDRLQRTTWKAILRLLGRRSGGGDPHAQFVEVMRSLHDLLEGYFDLFTGRFGSPGAARGWAETRAVFLADLKGLLDEL
jgi:hypothetical protein